MKRRKKSGEFAADGYVLEGQVGHLLRRAHQRHTAIFAAGMNDAQLTPMQFAALTKIRDEKEVSQNRLGRVTAMDPATVQGVVRRLGHRGLIVARPDPKDRRRSLWRLSGAGKRILQSTIPKAVQITDQTLEPIAARQRGQFISLLRKLA